jgi:EIN3-binding F-box protein
MNKAAVIIASNCSALENLMISQCPITVDGLSHVAKQCSKLNSLHIEGRSYMTEASLRALVQDAKILESLTLGSCAKIEEDAIMSFLMDHPYLGKFELKGMMAAESHLNGVRQSSLLL